MENIDELFEANKNLWNQRTVVHKDSAFYDLAGFKAGANVLTPIELNEIGDIMVNHYCICNVILEWIP